MLQKDKAEKLLLDSKLGEYNAIPRGDKGPTDVYELWERLI